MRSSTRESFSNTIPNVRGIIFYKKKYTPLYVTVASWEKEGCPSDCFVYDGINNLLSSGIPIQDAVEVEGRWIRTELKRKCPVTSRRSGYVDAKKRIRASLVSTKKVPYITPTEKSKRKKLK